LQQKQDIIIQYHREGLSQRQIAQKTGLHRRTVKKYIANYQIALENLLKAEVDDRIAEIDLIADIVEPPAYHVSNRQKRVLTIEMVEKIQGYLAENERKKQIGQGKQCKKIIDMHQALLEEDFEISYTTVRNTVADLLKTAQEAYIKIDYQPGQICEFDWGEVKLFINGKLTKLQMAVFTSAYSNYRFAMLFPNQKTESFVESHARFFVQMDGIYPTMVYDNMRVAVKRFVGLHEKEPTEALLKLSTYYGFTFRFCNIRSGHEKGHVERSVEVVRRKAFCSKDEFQDLAEANVHLLAICQKLNQERQSEAKKTSMERFMDEKPYLLLPMPMYESARTDWLRVDKYSTIQVDQCRYSVPEHFVGRLLFTKVYSTHIRCFDNNEVVSEHLRLQGCHEWSIQIDHYCRTLYKKPGALAHSHALKQADNRLKSLYHNHFQGREKAFVDVLFLCRQYGLDTVEKAVEELLTLTLIEVSADKIRVLCERSPAPISLVNQESSSIISKSKEHLDSYSALFPVSNEAFIHKGAIA